MLHPGLEFPAHSSSFDIHKRDLNGQISRFLKCWLQFSLVPIYGRPANKNIWHSAMISSVLARSPFGSSSIIREKKTGYIGSRLLLQHFSTLLGPEQPRYWHLLNHLTGCSKPLLMSCGSECLRVVLLLRRKDLGGFRSQAGRDDDRKAVAYVKKTKGNLAQHWHALHC